MCGRVGVTERPLCEAEKMKPKLQWQPQDAGNTRTTGWSLGETAQSGVSSRERLIPS